MTYGSGPGHLACQIQWTYVEVQVTPDSRSRLKECGVVDIEFTCQRRHTRETWGARDLPRLLSG